MGVLVSYPSRALQSRDLGAPGVERVGYPFQEALLGQVIRLHGATRHGCRHTLGVWTAKSSIEHQFG